MVLATNGVHSYVIFIYGNIEWGVSNIGLKNFDGSRFFMLPGALTNETTNIESRSNVGIPGVYIYRVDSQIGPEGETKVATKKKCTV